MENINQFVQRLKQSEIASSEVIELWLDRIANKSTSDFIKFLLKNEHLTRWQAKFLLSGNHKIKFGNYLLVNLIKSNPIGDLFLAEHLKLKQKVRIFFLSETLSQKLQKRKEVLRLAASASDINHPYLLHLHTIEFDSGRFLIVTDDFDSPSLNDPNRLKQLTEKDVPKIVLQLVEAGAAAHANGLSHGTITESDVLFSEAGHVKLQNSVSSFLVHNLGDDYTGPTNRMGDDIKAIERVGKRLLRRFSDSHAQAEKLNSILTKLGNQELSLWQTSDAIRSLYGLTARKSKANSAPTNSGGPPATQLIPQRQDPPQPPAGENKNSQSEHQPASSMGWLNWALPAMSAVLLLVIGSVLVWRSLTENDFATVATRSTVAANDTGDLPELDKPLERKERPNAAKVKAPQPINLETENANKEKASEELPDSSTAKEEFPKAESADSESDSQAIAETEAASAPNQQDSPAPEQTAEPNESKDASTILSSFNSISSKENQPKNANKENDATSSTGKSNVPTSVDLGSPSNSEQSHVATFANSQIDLQLITNPDIAPGRIQYELIGDSNSGWQITMQSQANSKSEIARLEMQERELKFTWTTNSELANKCGYLINGLLRIRSSDEAHTIALRKPFSIDGFKMDANEPKLKIEIADVPYPPNNAVSELNELDPKKYGDTFLGNDLDDRTFQRKKPLELHFRELAEYQMLFVRLKSDLKKKWRFEAEMLMALEPGQRPVLASSKTLEPAKAFLENQVAAAQQSIEYLERPIDDIRRERGLTKEQYPDKVRKAQKKDLKKQLELLKERSKDFSALLGQIQPVFETPVPITVYFEIDGERVVLASTNLD